MKGIILAGGRGTRLFPSTKVTNKHLLPVFDRPMIYYPIETLKNSGIREILIVTSAENLGDFLQLLGSGKSMGVEFTYKVQDGASGIADALSRAEGFAGDQNIAVILADSIFENSFENDALYFRSGAQIFVKKVDDPSRFGVVEMDAENRVQSIEEKPDFPKSKWAQTGLYLYDNQVFDLIRTLKPSRRGELEITDLNNIYLQKKQLRAAKVSGMWMDAGTHESLLEASLLAQDAFDPVQIQARQKALSPHAATQKSENHFPKIVAGLATFNSTKYLDSCLKSLLAQDYPNLEIVIFDNASTDETVSIIREKFPQVRVLQSDKNLGFGAAHNQILRNSECDFYACLNIDIIFEPSFLSELAKMIDEKTNYGSVGGKLKRWDFSQKENAEKSFGKTNFIDSISLRVLRANRFENLGEGEIDCGQFDQSKEVFGISGAAVLLRKKALDDVCFVSDEGEKEFFDESMFMYKEDVDLAYRLQWAGWKSIYAPAAVAYHDRTVDVSGNSILHLIKNRSKKSKRVNQVSYLNHQILLAKNVSGQSLSRGVQNATFWYNFKVFVYLLIFETELLGQWWHFFKLRKKIRAQREQLPKRVSGAEIEKFMEA